MKTKVVIIGAGPAGLTAGYLLSKEAVDVTVLEADPVYVGGISRTVTYKGFHFDIGGHRFFSKSKAVEDLWTEILPNDMLVRPRSSRIFYNGRFFSYPLKPFEALLKLGLFKSTLQYILQELHRKSMGDELQGNLRRLGCATDQRPFARQRDQERACSAALQWRPNQGNQDADQFLSLSAQRSRHDVGSVRRKDEGAGRQAGDGL